MSVNKVILIGNLGKDPEIKYTPSGVAVCTFSIATSERFKDREGQQQEKVEWHNIIAWRQLAEICGKYLVKGKQIYIEGKLTHRSYDDRDGNKRYITEVVADQMRMLGGRADNESSGQQNRSEPGNQSNQHSQGQNQNASQRQGQVEEPPFNPDDSIPF